MIATVSSDVDKKPPSEEENISPTSKDMKGAMSNFILFFSVSVSDVLLDLCWVYSFQV